MDNGEALTRVAQDFLVCIVTVWFIRYSWDGFLTTPYPFHSYPRKVSYVAVIYADESDLAWIMERHSLG